MVVKERPKQRFGWSRLLLRFPLGACHSTVIFVKTSSRVFVVEICRNSNTIVLRSTCCSRLFSSILFYFLYPYVQLTSRSRCLVAIVAARIDPAPQLHPAFLLSSSITDFYRNQLVCMSSLTCPISTRVKLQKHLQHNIAC